MGIRVARERGALGKFDVVVDGEVIASRGSGFGGWPDPEEVIARIEALQKAKAGG